MDYENLHLAKKIPFFDKLAISVMWVLLKLNLAGEYTEAMKTSVYGPSRK